MSKKHNKFIEDMEEAGFDIRPDYEGRNFYKGPAVTCSHSEFQDVIRATEVRLLSDNLGLDLIVYPA